MAWLQLLVDSTAESARKAENVLLGLGALSVTLQDNACEPIFEPALGEVPLWQKTRVTGLFDAEVDTGNINSKLLTVLPELSARWEQLEDKDWEREWMEHFSPIQCGENLWICPSWREPVDATATNILLDPGLAFGTGTHPTTFLCMQWLAKQSLHDKHVLDYGCGSGILAITAKKLGATQVAGVDIDPQAVIATRENGQRNSIEAKSLNVSLVEQSDSTKTYHIVLANILAGPLVELARTLTEHLAPGGQLCLSGILESQANTVMAAYSNVIEFAPVISKEGWVVLSGHKNDN